MLKINRKLMKKKVLFCAAEAVPLAKVGGLADVVGSLPAALRDQEIDARILMPAHSLISLRALGAKKLTSFIVKVGAKKETVSLYQARVQGTTYYLLQNKNYFKGEVYSGNSGPKYLFFCRAALASLAYLSFSPDIIHAHDFHAAPILTELSRRPRRQRPGLVLTIHNLQHQGWIEASQITTFGFNLEDFPLLAKSKEDNSWLNLLAAGIACADKVTTVSPNYAREILTPAYGQGLESLLFSRRRDLVGILNGINVDSYNPTKDDNLALNFNDKNLAKGKFLHKEAICSYLHLENNSAPLLVFIARFSWQKGLDLFTVESLRTLAEKYPFHLVLLGSGEEKYESLALHLEQSLPTTVRTLIAFDEVLARNLYAAADYFLVPSQFEPCGLTQMIAMRYGAVPIVRATGGLKDTVVDGGTGLVFKDYSPAALAVTLEKALRLYYRDYKKYQGLQTQGRRQDWSWRASAPTYRRLYDSV